MAAMDLEHDGRDGLMQDGEISQNGQILTSTEIDRSQPLAKGDTGQPSTYPNGADTSAGAFKSSTPILKGTGLKRDKEAVFDNHLTQLKDAPRPPLYDALPYASGQTGLVYDVRMRFHTEFIDFNAKASLRDEIHPEDPRRIHAIFEAFVEAGLAWRQGSPAPLTDFYMGRIPARLVSEEEVLLVHTKFHWDWVQSLKGREVDDLENEIQHVHTGQTQMDSVYMSPHTPLAAALSTGGAIEACRAIMLGKVKNVFAVIRPPGHHAEREDAKGFCFYDNVSIAAKVCQREFGPNCRKVFVLDWDVHHGNGIQQANYEDPNVLYVSLHVHENGNFYPERSYRDHRVAYGDYAHCGRGAGLGKNVNIPWSKRGMGDADYIYAFQQVIMPIATEFNPDLVIIAAGFDAAEGDMLGGCNVTPAGYAHMTHMLMSLAGGKLAVCLEGGYNLDSIARSATAVARTMIGEPPDRLEDINPAASSVRDVKLVLRQQSKFWASLYPKDTSARLAGPLQGERMHDIVRKWQATTLWDEYQMSPLFIHRETLSKSFENQVLATPTYTEARPLLVIFHDPPEMLASPDPRTGKLELHNTWLTDTVKTYVATAVQHGFAVIDVNLPRHVTEDEDNQEHEEDSRILQLTQQATDLLSYLWDNYIELADSTHIFLMGTNIGHHAITRWLKGNGEAAMDRVSRTIHLIADVALQGVRSTTNDALAPWYFRTSQVFVSEQHNLWETDTATRPRKKFGNLAKGLGEGMSDMLLAHKDEIFETMLEDTEEWRENRVISDDEEDAMDVSQPAAGTSKMPPIGNFALSQALQGQAADATRLSPPKAPPTGNFAPRASRSPAR